MHSTRRHFIKSGIGSIITMSLSKTLSTADSQSDRIPIAFQLYTVRGEFARDVPGTLKKLGEIGYKAVEFAGYGFGRDTADRGHPETHQRVHPDR